MNDQILSKPLKPVPSVERIQHLNEGDLQDLCDATEAAISNGGGFGWVSLPARDVLERYWRGVVAMPARILLVARMDGVICGTCQLLKPPPNNEAQKHAVQLTTHFVAPWARGHGLAKMLLQKAENIGREEGFSVINLDVRETMTQAISLYESQNYTRIGTHPHYAQIDGKMLKGYYYCKLIG